jgi:hypothetical protein
MKKIFIRTSLFLMVGLVVWACKKSDKSDPVIEGMAIDNYDVIQLTNDNPDVPVYIAFSDDRSIDSVAIRIYNEGTTTLVARNVIRNLTHTTAERVMVNTPFPYPDMGGPTGFYTVEYTIYDKAGKTNKKSYNVNILNNKTRNLCSFPSMTLPPGKNVWIRVTSTQPLAANEDVYITGAFEAANGGAGDWTGGASMFKLTKLSPQCFYIALNLTSTQEFKFTLGDWNREALGNQGQTPSNSTWNGTGTQDFTIYNWKGKPVVMQTIPQVLPSAGIQTGRMSVIADVNSADTSLKYFLVKKGGNLTDQSYPMYRVMSGSTATNKVIGSVPKDATVEYIVVRNNGGVVKEGVNDFGFIRSVKWDGRTNPVNISLPKFKDDPGIMTPPANLYIVGGATPGGWNNPVPVPSQQFTQVSPGKFELASIALTAGQEYLLLPVNGDWGMKYGGSSKLNGDIVVQGPNVPAPDVSGNYKITVDFTTGQYTLVKL